MIGVAVLGATGSIGQSTLDVISRHPEQFRAVVLTAHKSSERMAELCVKYSPDVVVMTDPTAAKTLQELLSKHNLKISVLAGPEALVDAVTLPEVSYVMAAIVGVAGLPSTLAAARAGKHLLLANKESLVVAGALLMDAVKKAGGKLLPIDSEHNAIFQCLPANFEQGLAAVGVEQILLTASGGPFRNWSREEMAKATVSQAVAHPKWSMGRKISVDSATMMNKGLEVIEACWLFHTDPDHIQVVVHPQSVIHSLVRYVDGSVLAQLGNPDMRTPIAHAMGWPQRIASGVSKLDLFEIARLDFQAPDYTRFTPLKLATQAAHRGGTASVILNAANEVAVGAFLNEKIGFLDIADIIAQCLNDIPVESVQDADLEFLIATDADVRKHAESLIATHH